MTMTTNDSKSLKVSYTRILRKVSRFRVMVCHLSPGLLLSVGGNLCRGQQKGLAAIRCVPNAPYPLAIANSIRARVTKRIASVPHRTRIVTPGGGDGTPSNGYGSFHCVRNANATEGSRRQASPITLFRIAGTNSCSGIQTTTNRNVCRATTERAQRRCFIVMAGRAGGD